MKIGLLGFGVVGRGVYELTRGRDDMQVVKVLRREDMQLPDAKTVRDIRDIVEDDSIDTVVEVMGGLHPAYDYVRAAIEGKHDADLIAVSQFAVGHGKFRKAAVGEPVVQRAHPAAALAAVKLTQLLVAVGDLADVAVLRAHSGVARRTQRAVYAAHHGGIRRQGHVGVHQRTLHLIILDVGIRGVLHDDVDTAEAAFAPLGHFGPHGGGDQAQRHDQCQEERNYAFLHLLFPPCDFLCSLYERLSALLPLSPFRKRRWERPGLASPTLMES